MFSHWVFDKKISIHFGEDKTKSVILGRKHKLQSFMYLQILNILKTIFLLQRVKLFLMKRRLNIVLFLHC